MPKRSAATKFIPGLAVAIVLMLSWLASGRVPFSGILTACGYGITAPAVTAVTPTSGPVSGGTTVTIDGCGFTGTTATNFGVTGATSFIVVSDSQITAVSPAHAAGAVDVTVTTPGGTSTTSAADQFTFVPAASQYVPVTPVRLMDTRSSGGALGPGAYRDLVVAGVTPGAPAGATAVVINVTVTGTTAASYLTVFPHGAAQPLASNLNWVAGKTIPNLVSVQVGGSGAITFFNAFGSTHVVVDLEGYFATASPAVPSHSIQMQVRSSQKQPRSRPERESVRSARIW